jgi:hypothetical protein
MELKFSSSILAGFKDLIENKHLYQSVSIKFPSFEEIYENVIARIPPSITGKKSDSLKECQYIYDSAPDFGWQIRSPRVIDYSALGGYGGPPVRRVDEIEFTPSAIKIFCPICDRIEPHNFYHGIDFSQSLKDTNNELLANSQIFLLAYECQSCKNPPTVFVVRREKMKLILSGRIPMEQVVVEKIIPKGQKKFFSDAIIAYNSGQILASKFLLRTFIEQYIREFTENKTSQDIDKLFEKYAKSLPQEFKDRFPSLADIYSKLSVDIHKADSSPELFTECQLSIEEHFEAKKVFKLP